MYIYAYEQWKMVGYHYRLIQSGSKCSKSKTVRANIILLLFFQVDSTVGWLGCACGKKMETVIGQFSFTFLYLLYVYASKVHLRAVITSFFYSFYFLLFFGEGHPAEFSAYSQIWVYGSLLGNIGNYLGAWDKPRWVTWKAIALLTVLMPPTINEYFQVSLFRDQHILWTKDHCDGNLKPQSYSPP